MEMPTHCSSIRRNDVNRAMIRFYGDLNEFLRLNEIISVDFKGGQSVKHIIGR
jgi:hypothetical protein